MLEPPPYSPHPAGSSIVTTTEDLPADDLTTSPPPDYQTVITQDGTNTEFSQSPDYRSGDSTVVQVVSTIEVLPPLPEYQREPGSESPPSYESLFGRVKAAQRSSSSNYVLCKSLCKVFLSSAFCMILLALFSALPVAEIVIGAVYMDDCPVAKYIPIYLVVMGVVCLVRIMSLVCQNMQNRHQESDNQRPTQTTSGLDQILNIFLLVWFILGNRWVYGANSVWVSDADSSNYCHPTLYYFAYWSITSFYIMCGGACLIMCVMTCICGNNRAHS